MSTTGNRSMADAGQGGWTRRLARDLFPGPTTPFAWTLLAAPAERALRNAYGELGGVAAASPFWRLDSRYAYLSEAAIAESDRSLCGAAWLGTDQPQAPGGLRGRLQAGGVIKRCQSRLATAMTETAGMQTRLSRWLAWVQGIKWTQADLLQVMEELEPHALAALQTYFLVRIGLNVAGASLEDHLREWLPSWPADVAAALALGAEGLPSITISEAVLAAARRDLADPERLATLARCSHRGPGEIRPDASRWPDANELLAGLASQGEPRWTRQAAAERRQEALAQLKRALNSTQFRQAEESLDSLVTAMRAADVAWDSLTMVMAAAQRWAGAAGREALTAGLIARPEDVLYLELEELKQVATGEWHAGDREEVQEAVSGRLREPVTAPGNETAPSPILVCPGPCDGPLYYDSPRATLPPAGATWLSETADPGCGPFWGFAGCLMTTGDDPWSPGMVAARGLGIPARVGVKSQAARSAPVSA